MDIDSVCFHGNEGTCQSEHCAAHRCVLNNFWTIIELSSTQEEDLSGCDTHFLLVDAFIVGFMEIVKKKNVKCHHTCCLNNHFDVIFPQKNSKFAPTHIERISCIKMNFALTFQSKVQDVVIAIQQYLNCLNVEINGNRAKQQKEAV